MSDSIAGRLSRLQRILAHRQAKEAAARLQTETAHHALQQVERRIEALRCEMMRVRSAAALHESAAAAIAAERYLRRTHVRIEELSRDADRARESLRRTRSALARAGRDRLAVERLVEQTRLQRTAILSERTQNEADDLGRLRLLMRNGAGRAC